MVSNEENENFVLQEKKYREIADKSGFLHSLQENFSKI